jgi:hypothetical protein
MLPCPCICDVHSLNICVLHGPARDVAVVASEAADDVAERAAKVGVHSGTTVTSRRANSYDATTGFSQFVGWHASCTCSSVCYVLAVRACGVDGR